MYHTICGVFLTGRARLLERYKSLAINSSFRFCLCLSFIETESGLGKKQSMPSHKVDFRRSPEPWERAQAQFPGSGWYQPNYFCVQFPVFI